MTLMLVKSPLDDANFLDCAVQMLSDAYKRELLRFDQDRALAAWEGLFTKQQESLAMLGVPSMFSTTAKTDREVGFSIAAVHSFSLTLSYSMFSGKNVSWECWIVYSAAKPHNKAPPWL